MAWSRSSIQGSISLKRWPWYHSARRKLCVCGRYIQTQNAMPIDLWKPGAIVRMVIALSGYQVIIRMGIIRYETRRRTLSMVARTSRAR